MLNKKAKDEASYHGNTGSSDIVGRLYIDQKKKEEKIQATRAKHDDGQCTFKPEVNHASLRKAEKAMKGRTFEERNEMEMTKY